MDFVSASQPRILDTAACAFRTCCRFLNISMLSSAVRIQLPTASLDERDAFQFRYSLGVEARDLGVAEAARKGNVTYWKAWYWLGKLQGAHPGLHGGHRYQTLTRSPNRLGMERVSSMGSRSKSSRRRDRPDSQRGELGSYWEGTCLSMSM
eukprot:g44392.t1